MNSAGKIAALLLLVGIAGCKHKVQTAPPQAAQAPVYPPSKVAQNAPPPQLPPPKPADVRQAPPEVAQQPPPKPKKQPHHKSKPADTTAQAAKDATSPAPGTQDASAGQPPAVSPIGQLSSSSDSSSALTRQQIQAQIDDTEKGVKGIKRTLSSDQQETVKQIQTFLTKAKKALDQNDLDGANTLVTKAKVLLGELTKG